MKSSKNKIVKSCCLDPNVFLEKMEKLKMVFRLDVEMDKDALKLYYEFLQDLDTKRFENAIKDMIQEQKQIYPNTNLIALIREYYNKWLPVSLKNIK